MNKPSLNALRMFEACARLQSFALAAQELNITPAAVSYQMQTLQATLGHDLFEKQGRSIRLTPIGQGLYEEVSDHVQALDRALHRLNEPTQKTLKFQAYMSISARWLRPRLAQFRARNPTVELELITSTVDWEFRPDLADCGLIYCAQEQDVGASTKLFPEEIAVVASPSDAGAASGDLNDCTFIEIADDRGAMDLWLSAQGRQKSDLKAVVHYDTQTVGIEAAIAGEGALAIQRLFVAHELENNTLVEIGKPIAEAGFWAFFERPDPRRKREVSQLYDHFVDEFQGNQNIGSH